MVERREVLEDFTFRSGDRAITLKSVIDTGATGVFITPAVVEALFLDALGHSEVEVAGGSREFVTTHHCEVGWTIYERQGYRSSFAVRCLEEERPLIGMSFLSAHNLTVDTGRGGLVGRHPGADAKPLVGGGYVINVPPAYVRRLNRERLAAAKVGKILRPHPAWRFTVPAISRSHPSPADGDNPGDKHPLPRASAG